MALVTFTGFDAQTPDEFFGSAGSLVFDTTIRHFDRGASLRLDYADSGTAIRSVSFRDGIRNAFSVAHGYFSFYIYIQTSLTGASSVDIFNSNTGIIKLNSDDTISLYNGATHRATSSALSKDAWHRIDVYINVTGAGGNWSFYVDGGLVGSGTNSGFSGISSHTGPVLGLVATATGATDFCFYLDDFFFDNAAFTASTNVALLTPNGNGNYTAWTNDYQACDEAPPYSQSDYIERTNSGGSGAETFAMTDLPLPAVSIQAIYGQIFINRSSGSGTPNINARIRSNGTDGTGSTITFSSSTVVMVGVMRTTDPSGAGAWTEARANAHECGVNLSTSGTYTIRVYWVCSQVAWVPSPDIAPTGIATAEAFGTATLIYPQNLSPGGIATAEAFGTTVVAPGARTLLPGGVATEEAFGTAELSVLSPPQNLGPAGIASEEAFGSVTLALGTVTVQPAGIGPEEAFGLAEVIPGGVVLQLAGISSAEVFGTAELYQTILLMPAGIDSLEAFGAAALVLGALTVEVGGIDSLEVFGTADLSPGAVAIIPSGIESLEAFGASELLAGFSVLQPTGIGSAEIFGDLELLAGAVALVPAGIDSAEAFGSTIVIVGALLVAPEAIGSAEAFGLPLIVPGGVAINIDGVVSEEAFGAPELSVAALQILVEGIASAEAFGVPTQALGAVVLQPGGISSVEIFGNPTLTATIGLSMTGIGSAEIFGAAVVVPGAAGLAVDGIASAEIFGLTFVNPLQYLSPDGIDSAGAFGDVGLVLVGFPGAVLQIGDQVVLKLTIGDVVKVRLVIGDELAEG